MQAIDFGFDAPENLEDVAEKDERDPAEVTQVNPDELEDDDETVDEPAADEPPELPPAADGDLPPGFWTVTNQIIHCEQLCKKAELVWEQKKQETKKAKADYDLRISEMRSHIEELKDLTADQDRPLIKAAEAVDKERRQAISEEEVEPEVEPDPLVEQDATIGSVDNDDCITNLDLPPHIHKSLVNADPPVETIGQVEKCSRDDSFPKGIGKAKAQKIRECLNDYYAEQANVETVEEEPEEEEEPDVVSLADLL